MSQKTDIIEDERRKSASFPDLPEKVRVHDIKKFFSGIDAYIADHFPLRRNLMALPIGLTEALGNSFDQDKCHRGKENWLFLGNHFSRNLDKLQGQMVLSEEALQRLTASWTAKRDAARKIGADFVLFIGPNKESVYPEFLHSVVTPAQGRYIVPMVNHLQAAGIKVYDPTNRLLEQKKQGLLYYRTDTHWNARGAYEAFEGFRQYAGLPELPALSFVPGPEFKGDLVDIGGFRLFPLATGDNDLLRWESPERRPVSEKTAWVFGDSFSNGLKPYLEATFATLELYGLADFEEVMSTRDDAPDLIIFVIVERHAG